MREYYLGVGQAVMCGNNNSTGTSIRSKNYLTCSMISKTVIFAINHAVIFDREI